ncbi:hypothetical protein NC653_030535 [Populus alba x Populus x berolinensis]|uniref:Uncharacterized protein n=1 Tax=Populus alba x Populus x berolinensis TaxID=444605 RepID=A0AAD6LWA7_9ROSI|nr:hypothetical protein NC653_030535 [Populus alba x Populus x berolinensis]
MDEKTKANFFHVIPLLPTSEVMDDVLEDSSAGTKDGMDGNVVELPFPPCDFVDRKGKTYMLNIWIKFDISKADNL